VNDDFLRAIPKAELHLHIEGTLEPELLFAIAERNRVRIPYIDVEALRAAYAFADLQSFLNLYYAGMSVLRFERDFFELAEHYFARARVAGVAHVEFFFDPQAHTARGVPLETVLDGLWEAVRTSEARYGISSRMIMCFLRDLPAADAMATLEAALPYGDRIIGVGLDSAERGHPPAKFREVFARARAEGWHAVAHAGEEGPPSYITEALDVLKAERIDHGIRCLEDPAVVERLVAERVPLTVCPLSNVALRVVDRIGDHPMATMLASGLHVTANSDDPAYFGGYVDDNLCALRDGLGMGMSEVVTLARNSFDASFLPPAEISRYQAEVTRAVETYA
jgi:adenosine deaminase